MKILTIIFLISTVLLNNLFAQSAIQDTTLAAEISKMFKEDQLWRKEFIKINRKERSDYSAETIQEKWATADSINEIKAKAIIHRYGFPGYKLVGETASSRFWAIVQHCDDDVPFQEHVLSLMKVEVSRNNADKRNYAYLTDRLLVNKGQKQIYGTQVITDKKTGKASPLPLKDLKNVNKLRRQMGMETLAVYLKSYN